MENLDITFSDWGAGSKMTIAEVSTRCWLNDGRANFTDVTASQMPEILNSISWDLSF